MRQVFPLAAGALLLTSTSLWAIDSQEGWQIMSDQLAQSGFDMDAARVDEQNGKIAVENLTKQDDQKSISIPNLIIQDYEDGINVTFPENITVEDGQKEIILNMSQATVYLEDGAQISLWGPYIGRVQGDISGQMSDSSPNQTQPNTAEFDIQGLDLEVLELEDDTSRMTFNLESIQSTFSGTRTDKETNQKVPFEGDLEYAPVQGSFSISDVERLWMSGDPVAAISQGSNVGFSVTQGEGYYTIRSNDSLNTVSSQTATLDGLIDRDGLVYSFSSQDNEMQTEDVQPGVDTVLSFSTATGKLSVPLFAGEQEQTAAFELDVQGLTVDAQGEESFENNPMLGVPITLRANLSAKTILQEDVWPTHSGETNMQDAQKIKGALKSATIDEFYLKMRDSEAKAEGDFFFSGSIESPTLQDADAVLEIKNISPLFDSLVAADILKPQDRVGIEMALRMFGRQGEDNAIIFNLENNNGRLNINGLPLGMIPQ